MKKIVALSLVVLMLASLLGGCAAKAEGDKGAIINAYLVQDPSSFSSSLDPGLMLYNAETAKVLNLIFEGLTVLDEKGNVKPGMAKSWKVLENKEDNTYKMQFELVTTRWSDGRVLSADDFVYAWKRILEPSFSSNAAALLYPIKNARNVREGDMTIDDLGLVALDTTLLEVTFEGPYDYDYFLRTVASPALVPLREDVINSPELWTEKASTLVSNGPFVVKAMEYQKEFTLERSVFYHTNGKDKVAIDKYVKPYRFVVRYQGATDADLVKQIESFNNGTLFYLGGVNAASYPTLKGKAEEHDMLNMYTYYFNTSKAPFDKAEVRKALSIAIDRDHVAELVGTGVKPVTGFVPAATSDETPKKSFREVGGDQFPAGGDIPAAKQLLATAGVSSGSITLKIRANSSDKLVGAYVAEIWQQLGFTVTVEEVKGVQYLTDLTSSNFDVMAMDYQCLTDDAFSIFAPFAVRYSGGVMNFDNPNGEGTYTPHLTKFDNEAYNAKIEEAYAATNAADRTRILHEVEKLFIDQSPAMALYSNVNFVATDKLSGITFSKFGLANLTKVSMSNYRDYLPTEAPETESGAATTTAAAS